MNHHSFTARLKPEACYYYQYVHVTASGKAVGVYFAVAAVARYFDCVGFYRLQIAITLKLKRNVIVILF